MLPEAGADRARRFPRAAGSHDSQDIRRRERSWNREGRRDMTEEIGDIQRDRFPRNRLLGDEQEVIYREIVRAHFLLFQTLRIHRGEPGMVRSAPEAGEV